VNRTLMLAAIDRQLERVAEREGVRLMDWRDRVANDAMSPFTR